MPFGPVPPHRGPCRSTAAVLRRPGRPGRSSSLCCPRVVMSRSGASESSTWRSRRAARRTRSWPSRAPPSRQTTTAGLPPVRRMTRRPQPARATRSRDRLRRAPSARCGRASGRPDEIHRGTHVAGRQPRAIAPSSAKPPGPRNRPRRVCRHRLASQRVVGVEIPFPTRRQLLAVVRQHRCHAVTVPVEASPVDRRPGSGDPRPNDNTEQQLLISCPGHRRSPMSPGSPPPRPVPQDCHRVRGALEPRDTVGRGRGGCCSSMRWVGSPSPTTAMR